jgi:hypothetical protein
MSDIDTPYELPGDEYRNRVGVLIDRLHDLQVRDMRAVRAAAERIVEQPSGTTHTVESAAQMLTATVDPRAVRANQIRTQRVRGGRILHLLRATVWTPLLLVDATNGRFVVGQAYLSDPQVIAGTTLKVALAAPDSSGTVPSLIYRGTRQAVATALDENADYVRQANSWEADIRINGILMPLLAGHVEYRFTDAPSRPAVGVVDGTSRTASAHRILGLAESDIVAATPESQRKWLTQLLKKLTTDVEALASDPPDQEGLLIAEGKVNALTAEADLIVGWGWDEQTGGRPSDVEPTYASTLNLALGAQNIEPKSFSAEAQGTLLAERSVNTLADHGLINHTELVYALGREDLTRFAEELGYSRHRDERCAWLIRLMTTAEPRRRRVLNETLNTKAFSAKNRSRPAIELALRSFSGQDSQYLDRARNAAVHALWTSVGAPDWTVPARPDDAALGELEDAALAEVRGGQPGVHCQEVAARGIVPLLALGGLGVDRGSAQYRGQPAVVIGRMMKNEWGIRQLMATVRASREGRPFPRLGADGRPLPDEAQRNTPSYNNDWLREQVLSAEVTTPVTEAEEPEKALFRSLRTAWDSLERYRELKDPAYDSLTDDNWREAARTAGRLSKNIDKYVKEED